MPAATNPFLRSAPAVRSLNRARIVELPGGPAADAIPGMTGYDLLSSASLRRQILAAADRLGLDPAHDDLVRHFDACFDDPAARPHALEIARVYGRRIGCLLLMLRRGDAANRAARPEWTDAHWAFWRSVRTIYLGGGVMAGQLGRHAVVAARALLADAGIADLSVQCAPFAAHLPLVGLARSAPPGVTSSIVLDFGQSSVKRGCASYRDGQLVELEVWPAAPSACGELLDALPAEDVVRRRWQQMAGIVADSWASLEPGQRQRAAIGISMACYLYDGHPAPDDQGCYGALRLLAPHLATFTEHDLARRLGQAVPIVLLHDGAAAAAAYAGQERAVVMTLGTAIGNGFPPDGTAAWPVAADFVARSSACPRP